MARAYFFPFFPPLFWLAGGSGVIVVQPRGRRADDGHIWRGDLESGKGRAADTAAHSATETAERKVSRLPSERVQHIKGKSLSEENKERLVSIMMVMMICNRSAIDAAQCSYNTKRRRATSLTTTTGPSARQEAAPTTKSTVTSIARGIF